MKRFEEFVRDTQPQRDRIMTEMERSVKENANELTDAGFALQAGLAVLRKELELYHNWLMEQLEQ